MYVIGDSLKFQTKACINFTTTYMYMSKETATYKLYHFYFNATVYEKECSVCMYERINNYINFPNYI